MSDAEKEAQRVLPPATVELVDALLWDASLGPAPTVRQVRNWMRELLLHPDKDDKLVQSALINCRKFLDKNIMSVVNDAAESFEVNDAAESFEEP